MIQFARQNAYLKEMKINVAGKTGTAQEAKTRPEHSLFIDMHRPKNQKFQSQ